jgi:hypothetical protein
MYKFLFPVKNYLYKACNSIILSLSIILKNISLEFLDYRPKISLSTQGNMQNEWTYAAA